MKRFLSSYIFLRLVFVGKRIKYVRVRKNHHQLFHVRIEILPQNITDKCVAYTRKWSFLNGNSVKLQAFLKIHMTKVFLGAMYVRTCIVPPNQIFDPT